MVTTQQPAVLTKADFDEQVLETIEVLLAQVRAWQAARRIIHAQIVYDFQLTGPGVDQAGEIMHRMYILADVLLLVAAQLEAEVEETMDRWHTWLVD